MAQVDHPSSRVLLIDFGILYSGAPVVTVVSIISASSLFVGFSHVLVKDVASFAGSLTAGVAVDR